MKRPVRGRQTDTPALPLSRRMRACQQLLAGSRSGRRPRASQATRRAVASPGGSERALLEGRQARSSSLAGVSTKGSDALAIRRKTEARPGKTGVLPRLGPRILTYSERSPDAHGAAGRVPRELLADRVGLNATGDRCRRSRLPRLLRYRWQPSRQRDLGLPGETPSPGGSGEQDEGDPPTHVRLT